MGPDRCIFLQCNETMQLHTIRSVTSHPYALLIFFFVHVAQLTNMKMYNRKV